MSSSGASNAGKDIAEQVKQGATAIHGAGEAIRGNLNQVIDGAFNEKEGTAKNQKVIDKGINEINDGQYRGHPESEKRF